MSKFHRHIFYISGFDPRGPAFYHSLCKAEVKKYAALGNMDEPAISAKNTGLYRTDWAIETNDCKVDYTFLRWDDIVRERWRIGWLSLLRHTLKTYYSYIFAYDYRRAKALKTTPFITFYTPLILAAVSLVLALTCALLFGVWAGIAIPLCCALPFILFKKWRPLWLLHTFNFNDDIACNKDRDFIDRSEIHAKIISDAIAQGGHDEYLIVGHSNGVSLLLLVLENLSSLKKDGLFSRVKVLSMGQLTQLASLRRHAHSFKTTIEQLARVKVPWLDISAKGDPACIPMVGPFAGVLETQPQNITISSARLHTLYEEADYKKLRRDKFNFHFLYLKCSDRLGAFNYPGIIINPVTLEQTISNIKAASYVE